MSALLLVLVVVVTVAAVFAGLYLTFGAFRALDHPPVAVKPPNLRSNPHDATTTAQLSHFFEGKTCAACGRSIQPMHAGDLRPGLVNVTTHEAVAWHQIPSMNLSTTLESHAPICSNCVVLATFRQQHPDMVVERHRSLEPKRVD
jgi:hypothetical protein